MYLKEYITFKKDVFLILSQVFNKEKSSVNQVCQHQLISLSAFFHSHLSTNSLNQLMGTSKTENKRFTLLIRLWHFQEYETVCSSFGITIFLYGMAFGGQNVARVNECQPVCQQKQTLLKKQQQQQQHRPNFCLQLLLSRSSYSLYTQVLKLKTMEIKTKEKERSGF